MPTLYVGIVFNKIPFNDNTHSKKKKKKNERKKKKKNGG